jgi:hypothetical protein
LAATTLGLPEPLGGGGGLLLLFRVNRSSATRCLRSKTWGPYSGGWGWRSGCARPWRRTRIGRGIVRGRGRGSPPVDPRGGRPPRQAPRDRGSPPCHRERDGGRRHAAGRNNLRIGGDQDLCGVHGVGNEIWEGGGGVLYRPSEIAGLDDRPLEQRPEDQPGSE